MEVGAVTETMYPGGIDICSFNLNDGFCAGSAQAVRHFLSALIRGFRRIGLEVNLDKTEVIPACSSSQSFAPGDFPGCVWVESSNFKLLGAPLGSSGWCLFVAPSLALVRFVRFSALPMGSVVMCLRPSLLAWRFFYILFYFNSFSSFLLCLL